MSQTESLGVADATRWVGVAASMVEFLDLWLVSEQVPTVPRGIFAGAHRFLNQALEGIALDRRKRFKPEIPIMAGISNLNIALGVLHRLARPESLACPENLPEVETKLKGYSDCLEAIERGQSRLAELAEPAKALRDFFRELQDQGNRARHAAFAHDEAPQV